MNSLLVAFILIFLNLLFLDWQIMIASKNITLEKTTQQTTVIQAPEKNEKSCSPSCLAAIEQATASAAQPAIVQTKTLPAAAPQEHFIPFGSSSSSSTDWQSLTGLQAYVDTANYSRIKTVTFEASVHVPTGNETVNIRLYNVTDSHPVWNSDVFFNGGTNSQLLISQPITLDKGNKLYQVQMQTQLTFPAILDQARLHILTN